MPVAADRVPTPVAAVPVAADRVPAPVAATPIAADAPDRVVTPSNEPTTAAPTTTIHDDWTLTIALIAALALGTILAAALLLARRHGPVPRPGA